MKHILSLARQAVQKYNMIEKGDKIAVAVSGGKDSMVLLEAMSRMQKFYPAPFSIGAVYIDIGFGGNLAQMLAGFCGERKIPFHEEKSIIKEVVFNFNKTKSPCSLCSRMRRAALCDTAVRLGYNKIALGHSMDDAIETFIMNLFYNGKTECFEPITLYEDINVSLIRPLICTPEKEIKAYAYSSGLPVAQKICPADGKTDREKTKKIIAQLCADNKNIKKSIFSAIENLEAFRSKVVKP